MIKIENVESLTPQVFLQLLKEKWQQGDVPNIESVSTAEKVEQGVLSNCYRIHLNFAVTQASSSLSSSSTSYLTSALLPPADWLVKLCRSDLNLSWMCRNEANFYCHIVPHLDVNDLPFSVPYFLSGDDQHIILQEVKNIHTLPLTKGCPPDKINFLLQSMVCLHATCWDDPIIKDIGEKELVFPVGMGQRLHPLQKEGVVYYVMERHSKSFEGTCYRST